MQLPTKTLLLSTLLTIPSLSLAAECTDRFLVDVADSSTFSSFNYEDNWWRAREALCGSEDPCFDQSKDCTVEIIMDGRHTLRLSRSSQDSTADFSTCWDATAEIIQQCVRDLGRAEGSWTLSSGAYAFSLADTPAPVNAGGAAEDPSLPTPSISPNAPNCSDCGDDGDSGGKCRGGFFAGRECCGEEPGPCNDNGCDGVNGRCTNHWLGCECFGGKSAPTGTPTDCNKDCCGVVLDMGWCQQNCGSTFNTPCGLCVC